MYSFLTIFLLISLTLTTPSEASHEEKLQSSVVIGKVYCDTCFQEGFSKSSHFISGNHSKISIFTQTVYVLAYILEHELLNTYSLKLLWVIFMQGPLSVWSAKMRVHQNQVFKHKWKQITKERSKSTCLSQLANMWRKLKGVLWN